MGAKTQIDWTDKTYNPWQGCLKISPGCAKCYMYRDKDRYGQDGGDIHRSAATTFNSPLHWKEKELVFTCSWSDFFIDEADAWRPEAWDIIRRTPHLTYQILTKRPERILKNLPPDWGNGWDNVWLGVSVETQKYANERIPKLMEVPTKVRFLSIEPLLGAVDITNKGINDGYDMPTGYDNNGWGIEWTDPGDSFIGVDWVIIGGESGNDTGKWGYRPCSVEWIQSIIAQCKNNDVPVFFKQFGTHLAKQLKITGAGKDHSHPNFPDWAKLKEFPRIFNYDRRELFGRPMGAEQQNLF